MPTFVYSPQIRVRVATRQHGVLDISDDLVSGVLNIRTNAVHTFSFQLQNAQRKYDSVLQPMDRITVEMKRVSWVRVFSGYLNNGPIFSVWPRVLNITASCTLKRLQFWYWDSTTKKSFELLSTMNNASPQQASGADPALTGAVGGATAGAAGIAANRGSPIATDEGLRQTVVRLLDEVVGWPQERVHISEVPPGWYDFADSVASEIIADNDVSDLLGSFKSTATIAGSTVGTGGGNGTLIPGSFGGVTLNAEQAANAAIIYNVAISRGLSPQAAMIAIATAMQESSLQNLNYGDRDSLGLFQQRPSQGWGTPAQVTDPVYAANKFFDALVAIPGWEGLPLTQAAQQVQRSAYPDAYAKWEGMASAAVQSLSASGGGGGGGANIVGGVNQAGGQIAANVTAAANGSAPIGSGRNVALIAASLIQRNPPGHIRYQLGGNDTYSNPDPQVLDCSSFVDWVYYNSVGTPWITPRSTAAAEQAAVQPISVATALTTKGALLFKGNPATHVEISLGNGQTAGAHTDSVPLEQQVDIGPSNASAWTNAGLMPGVNYSDAGTTPAAASELSQVTGQATTVTDPNETGTGTLAGGLGLGGVDPMAIAQAGRELAFNDMVNVYAWGLQPNTTGDLLGGARALMNDEPLLPYIGNLMAACMRSWCSAPNGDFIAWFPDYFGIWSSAAAMDVRSIELMDFTVDWYDQEIVTHQYVIGTPFTFFDQATGNTSGQTTELPFGFALTSLGIATMDYPQIFKAIFRENVGDQFVNDYLDRFGGRPSVVNIPVIQQGNPEFFMALYLFMQRWAAQFRANVPMTFMPELWPGMLLRLPEYNFQAYITEVQHTFQFGPGGGFHTSAQIVAPARLSGDRTDILGLLPLGGPQS